MSASSNPNQQKKRVGRKRLPPLPPGPGLQFVVAGHPDEFKKDETMRNIRSHVMYKHRGEQRGGSKSPKGKGSGRSSRQLSQGRTPSPIATSSAGSYEDNQFITSERQQAVWDSELYRLMSHSPSTDSVSQSSCQDHRCHRIRATARYPFNVRTDARLPFLARSSSWSNIIGSVEGRLSRHDEFTVRYGSARHLLRRLWTLTNWNRFQLDGNSM